MNILCLLFHIRFMWIIHSGFMWVEIKECGQGKQCQQNGFFNERQ